MPRRDSHRSRCWICCRRRTDRIAWQPFARLKRSGRAGRSSKPLFGVRVPSSGSMSQAAWHRLTSIPISGRCRTPSPFPRRSTSPWTSPTDTNTSRFSPISACSTWPRTVVSGYAARTTACCAGAKSRKGYGSPVLQDLRVNGQARWSTPRSMDELRSVLAALRPGPSDDDDGSGSLPEFTALSSGARHVLLSSGSTEPLELLNLVGRALIWFRSWGRAGKILGGQDSEKNFRYDLVEQQVRSSQT